MAVLVPYAEKIDTHKIRNRSKSFFDHFSQATLFFNSQTEPEKKHIIDALKFELGKVETIAIRERMLYILQEIDRVLAQEVAKGLRLDIPKSIGSVNQLVPADIDPKSYQPVYPKELAITESPSLSIIKNMVNSLKTIATRKVAIIAADGANENSIMFVKKDLLSEGAVVHIIAPTDNYIIAENEAKIMVDKTLLTTASVLYDAVYVAGGAASIATLKTDGDAIHFLNEAFKHCKPIAASLDAKEILELTYFANKLSKDKGIVMESDLTVLSKQFILAMSQHRFWERENYGKIPA